MFVIGAVVLFMDLASILQQRRILIFSMTREIV